jgi:MFS family permease
MTALAIRRWAERARVMQQFGTGFWTLYGASCLIDLGLCLYFFLFSLFMVERNVSVHDIGFIAASQTIGTIGGTLAASFLISRLGLRRMMMLYIFLAPVCLASRLLFLQLPAQIVLAALAGAMMSLWSVCFSPTVAKLTSHNNRAFAFSLFVATGISSGALAGLLGGHLPQILIRHGLVSGHAGGVRAVLLLSCCILGLAAFALARLRLDGDAERRERGWVVSGFLLRFLIAIALWNFAIGFFTPFANVYLSRELRLPLERVGEIYTVSQLVQVAMVLLAPLIYRRAGLVAGIALAQVVTGVLFWVLPRIRGTDHAVWIYLVLMGLQWMSGPGISSLLMNQTPEADRSRASAMQNMTNLATQAGAAALAGKLYERYGYSGPLAGNAGVAILAALLLYWLLRDGEGSISSSEPPCN